MNEIGIENLKEEAKKYATSIYDRLNSSGQEINYDELVSDGEVLLQTLKALQFFISPPLRVLWLCKEYENGNMPCEKAMREIVEMIEAVWD